MADIEKAKELLEEIKTAAGESQRDVFYYLKADQALSALDEKPVCETCSNGKGKGWFACPVCKQPICQKPPDDDFTKAVRDTIDVELESANNYFNSPKKFDGDISTFADAVKVLCSILGRACARLDAQKQEIAELEKDKAHLEDIESDLNNTIGFLQTGVDNWKKTADGKDSKGDK